MPVSDPTSAAQSGRIPADVSAQLVAVCELIERHLGPVLQAIYLYGSAVEGGLKRYSDLDLLVVLTAQPEQTVRCAFMRDLLGVSAPPGRSDALRALEVTAVVRREVVPWRYPARRELQFGEWLREDILAGVFEPAVSDPDLAVLLTQARQASIALLGLAAGSVLEAVPPADFRRVLSDTLEIWRSPSDWSGDERNVVLTLARIWYSAATGKIVPKDVAADWAMERLSGHHRSVLLDAREATWAAGRTAWRCAAMRWPTSSVP